MMFPKLARVVLCMVMRFKFTPSICIGVGCLLSVGILTPADALPSLETQVISPSAVLYEPFSIQFDVSWSGDPAEYSSVPPVLDIAEWATVSNVVTSTNIVEGKNIIRHTVTLSPQEVGTFSIPAPDIPYFSPSDLIEIDKSDEGGDGIDPENLIYPTLHAGVISVTVVEPTDKVLLFVMIVGAGVVLSLCAFLVKRRKTVRIARLTEYSELSVSSIIHDSRKHKLDQDYYSFYRSLLRAAGLLKNMESRKELQKYYEELTLAAGYQGLEISDDDMDIAIEKLEVAYRNDVKNTSMSKKV